MTLPVAQCSQRDAAFLRWGGLGIESSAQLPNLVAAVRSSDSPVFEFRWRDRTALNSSKASEDL